MPACSNTAKIYPHQFVIKSFFFQIVISCMMIISCKEQVATNSNYFAKGEKTGKLENRAIDEASGLVASKRNPGFLWTHNDSGDEARIFLIDSTGNSVATVYLNGITNRDWEDIAIGGGPDSSKVYLYIGDIGDNFGHHDYKLIYRIEEPKVSTDQEEITISRVDSIKFSLPGGPRDAEALMIDPHSNDLYLFSKRERAINLYRISYPHDVQKAVVAEEVALELPFTRIVAADWSSDGNEILIKSYEEVFYWKRKDKESIAHLMRSKPFNLPYKTEPQGESIAFSYDGNGYYTLSEKTKHNKPTLMFYNRVIAVDTIKESAK